MSVFTKFDAEAHVAYHPHASAVLGKDYWVVTKSFTYAVGNKFSRDKVYVPDGYLTDGASVPRVFWSLIPPWSSYGQAAILHDYICEYGFKTRWVIDKQNEGKYIQTSVPLTRKEADEIFEEAMYVLDVPKYKIKLIMSAVDTYRRLFKPDCPSLDDKKKGLEEMIRNRNRELGGYVF